MEVKFPSIRRKIADAHREKHLVHVSTSAIRWYSLPGALYRSLNRFCMGSNCLNTTHTADRASMCDRMSIICLKFILESFFESCLDLFYHFEQGVVVYVHFLAESLECELFSSFLVFLSEFDVMGEYPGIVPGCPV